MKQKRDMILLISKTIFGLCFSGNMNNFVINLTSILFNSPSKNKTNHW